MNRFEATRSGLKLMAALVFLGLVPGTAMAAGAPAGNETFLGLPRFVWLWGNLFVFWGGLLYFMVPIIRKFLQERGEQIRESAKLAARQRSEAEEMRKGLEAKIAELRADMNDFLERNEQEGEREREEIQAQAARDKERVLEEARGEIAHRFNRARAELLEQTSEQAAGLAAAKLSSELETVDGGELFDSSLAQLREKLS